MDSPNSPLNTFVFCPYCGKPGFKPESEKSLRCNVCGFRYFINMSAAVVAIIRNEDNEVLFTLRKFDPYAGMLDLPGGFIDLDETAEDAVKREILEELNLKITSFQYLGSFPNRYNYDKIEYQTLDLVYNCSVETLQSIKAADDVNGFVFRNPADVKNEEIGLESIKNIIRHLSTI